MTLFTRFAPTEVPTQRQTEPPVRTGKSSLNMDAHQREPGPTDGGQTITTPNGHTQTNYHLLQSRPTRKCVPQLMDCVSRVTNRTMRRFQFEKHICNKFVGCQRMPFTTSPKKHMIFVAPVKTTGVRFNVRKAIGHHVLSIRPTFSGRFAEACLPESGSVDSNSSPKLVQSPMTPNFSAPSVADHGNIGDTKTQRNTHWIDRVTAFHPT